MRVCICGTQVPFARGGAEMLVESLQAELVARGCEVAVVTLPFHLATRVDLLKGSLAWRLIDLTQAESKRIDRVIATRFPSYLVAHPHKVVWLVHQLRQVYDLRGTEFSDFSDSPRDAAAIEMVRGMDRRGLSEARAVYTISRNVSARLLRSNGLSSQVLYPPPRLDPLLHGGAAGDFVLAPGRLDRLKRTDLLIRALKHTETPVRCVIAGAGPELAALGELAERQGVAARVDLLGWTSDEELVAHYAGCLCVYFAPHDEDYGYVTVEAFRSGKPVLTATDSGGVLEFVADGINGYVVRPDAPRELAARLDLLYRDKVLAARLGAAGERTVREIGWDQVVSALTG